ncbi:MAG: hypothetical protein ICV66_03935 [Chitinophagaceae bacterium]|nr:hypothetical protein [Chitinophagaceae bacterium]
MKSKIFIYDIRAPRTARESFVVRPLNADPGESPLLKMERIKAFWPSGLSAQNTPNRIITLSEIVVENIIYKCMLIFVPVEEQDVAGRSGLYLCNAVLAQSPTDLILFLSESDDIKKDVPALAVPTPNGLNDFSHISGVLQKGGNDLFRIVHPTTLDRVYRASHKNPVCVATNIDKDSFAITELFAFSFWLDKNLPVSTYEQRPRGPWGLSFLPLETTYKVSGVINNMEKVALRVYQSALKEISPVKTQLSLDDNFRKSSFVLKHSDKSPKKLSTYERVRNERLALNKRNHTERPQGEQHNDATKKSGSPINIPVHDAAFCKNKQQQDSSHRWQPKLNAIKLLESCLYFFFCFSAGFFGSFALRQKNNKQTVK